MTTQFSVFAYLHGRVTEKFDCTLGTCDDGVSAIKFKTHAEDYVTYVPVIALTHARLVLFDGFILPHGMPRGATLLDYEYGRIGDKFNQFAQKVLTWQEDRNTVRGLEYTDGQVEHLRERSMGDKPHLIRATVKRQLLLLPKGHTAFGFRVKPRSLERQYTMIDVEEHQVIFRTTAK